MINISYSYESIDSIHSILSQIIHNIDASGRVINPELSISDLTHLILLEDTFTLTLKTVIFPQRDEILLKYCSKNEKGEPMYTDDGEPLFTTEESAKAANDDIKKNLDGKTMVVKIQPIPAIIWTKIKNISGDAVRLLAPIVLQTK